MTSLGLTMFCIPFILMLLAYLGYPAGLWVLAQFKDGQDHPDLEEWPEITLVVPVYNEEASIRPTIQSLLKLEYPADRLHILVISDASNDRTEAIVEEYAPQGVRLVRLKTRSGKTAAENEAAPHLRGTIVVNTDATIRIPPHALKPLVAVFKDPTVGVASGRDISVGQVNADTNVGESGYVSYEMWVRDLETKVHSIVGASGCFYAIRRPLFDHIFPAALSRDFASPLIAREQGFRSVSVPKALAIVRRTRSLRSEYRRKVRTMTRGLETLWFKKHLLNPIGYGAFAWMLLGHKLLRWLVFLVMPFGMVGLALLSTTIPLFRIVLGGVLLTIALGTAAVLVGERHAIPRPLGMIGYVVVTFGAGFVAWVRAIRGDLDPIWEPTRRPEAEV